MTTAQWPARCVICGRLVKKSESHAGAPGSPQPVRHLDCALKTPANRMVDKPRQRVMG